MKTKLVIFGMTGDLSRRKLLPAIEHIFDAGELPDLSIIGVSRRQVDVNELLQESIGHADIAEHFSVFTMDLAKSQDYERLREYIDLGDDEQVLFYLSVPPSAAADIVDFLGQAGLNTPNIKLLFEKPFGFDYESAKEYIDRTARYYSEEQIYRIDHYMAKDIAQELIHEHVVHEWSNQTITSIEVTATETIGIEGRAFFYEETGALRDFLQGHLLQLLSLVLADPLNDKSLAERRLMALENLATVHPEKAFRAQYDGYQTEVENEGSLTETFAAFEITSKDPRWQGVTMSLVTGKAMDKKRSYVRIVYKDGHEQVYEEGVSMGQSDRQLSAYERVLVEAIHGRKEIFTTGPEVLRSWQLVADIQQDWSFDDTPLAIYTPGSSINDVLDR